MEFDGDKSIHHKIYSKFKSDVHFLPFLLDMPALIGQITKTYESGARYLVENKYIEKEDMRVILEDMLEKSISEINDLLDTVKIEEVES